MEERTYEKNHIKILCFFYISASLQRGNARDCKTVIDPSLLSIYEFKSMYGDLLFYTWSSIIMIIIDLRDLNYDHQNAHIPSRRSHYGSFSLSWAIIELCLYAFPLLMEVYNMNFWSSFHRHGEIHNLIMNMHNSHKNCHIWLYLYHASSAVHASSRNP